MLHHMKRFFVSLLLVGVISLPAAPARAQDVNRPVIWRYSAPGHELLPFPRGEQTRSVWASDGCWSDCGAHCTWGIAGCLTRDAQGHCLKLGDACDRYCQRQCRTMGGPLLPDIFDAWE